MNEKPQVTRSPINEIAREEETPSTDRERQPTLCVRPSENNDDDDNDETSARQKDRHCERDGIGCERKASSENRLPAIVVSRTIPSLAFHANSVTRRRHFTRDN